MAKGGWKSVVTQRRCSEAPPRLDPHAVPLGDAGTSLWAGVPWGWGWQEPGLAASFPEPRALAFIPWKEQAHSFPGKHSSPAGTRSTKGGARGSRGAAASPNGGGPSPLLTWWPI